eukprot:TRINITY_DN14806_c0_g3_i1.p1 TRINITY_DN14806_c0_g3~~TRINITY_DN14806_c0_g3_i1.p1  ORF type:complete len:605 (+),score=88.73 TRINITY_DN14806_c0_g3_i1:284-2098(+)
MVDPHKQVDMANVLHRLLAQEREKLAEFIHASHMTLASHFEHDVALLREGNMQDSDPAGPPATGYSVAGTSLHGNFVSCGKVNEPLADAALPDTIPCDNSGAPGEEAVNGTRLIVETLNGTHCKQLSPPDKETQSGFPASDPSASMTSAGGFSQAFMSMSSAQLKRSKSVIREEKEAAVRPGCLRRIVDSATFELVFAFLIFFNALCMAMEQQYVGIETSYKLQLAGATDSAKDSWPHAELAFELIEIFFGVIFACELVVKVIVFGRDFPKSFWNVYDAVMVLCWIVERTRMFSVLDSRVLRLAKMLRLLRLLRLAKAFQVFDVLHLLTHSLLACMTALMWSAVMLFLVMMGTALVLIYLLQGTFDNESIPYDERALLYTYFGNFSNGLFSMYEITMGNWVPISRAVIRNVGDWYMLFFITYRTIVGFAVLRVVSAIFTAETLRVAQSDDGIMLMERERQIKMHTVRMHHLLSEGDESQDGFLSLEEFHHLLADKRIQTWLSAQEIEVKDVDLAYRLIDDSGDGRVCAEELVRGFSRLKGAAKSIDMLTVIHAFDRVQSLLERLDADLHARNIAQQAMNGTCRLNLSDNPAAGCTKRRSKSNAS